MPLIEQVDPAESRLVEPGHTQTAARPGTDTLSHIWQQAGFGRRVQLVFSFLTMLTFLLACLQFVMARGVSRIRISGGICATPNIFFSTTSSPL